MVYPGQLHYSSFKAPILNRPIDDPGRKLRIICVGAGISGVTTAIRFRQHLGANIDLQIYEKNADIGGVWLENRYPGVACDIPAPCFAFLFEDNPDWSEYYAGGKEINAYVQRVATKYSVRKLMKFQHPVQEAIWHEDEGKWRLKIHDVQNDKMIDDEADIVVMAWGMLNNWEFPKIPGISDFKGANMHTANYDESFDPTDKVVALVGGGSTGVQVLPHIQEKAKRIHHYMRSQNWIAPVGFGAGELEKRDALEYRRGIEDGIMAYMAESGFTYGSPEQQKMEVNFRAHMNRALGTRPEILKTLLPDFPPGCRRLVPGPGYLEAVVKENIEWIPEQIEKVTEEGIVTKDGTLHECDAIIWATGFICDFRSRFPVTGRDGITWNQVMDPEPEAYFGVLVDKMPNCFLYFGPNCAPGAGNAYLAIETECELMISCIKKMLREKIKSICIKQQRVKQYVAHVNEYLKGTIFGQPCKSWFKRGDPTGRNIAYYPGNSLNLLHAARNPRWEDFDYIYLDELGGNPLTWLGNGYTMADYDGSSRTSYLDPAVIDYPPIPKADVLVDGNVKTESYEKVGIKAPANVSVVLLPGTTAA
ncbi:FAD/NAD(P)-binding domain-containing protein [Mytilinidion resinicola]|uniref:FAD/NAD(P)-binding domain-containing protein n=1 Tax=Mytilinidion resinicola TaxID=574789 RepID=A0A6A6XZT7_9PEZI|nr:FAD/NAD(P)-binding domain-containing protein [Mytilinidion resinicola]KAF2801808.1 FAD/NAD(P)-binding domain-containing protein [Mytilinidion resinicola]